MRNWKTWNRDAFSFKLSNTVHVWLLSLIFDDSQIDYFKSLLSEDEKNRAARFRFDKPRKQFIAARGQLRILIAAYTKLLPEQIRFKYNSYGKPSLEMPANSARLFFNVSHSHQLALIAFSNQYELGVDIEWVPPDFNGLHLASRFFSQKEVKQLRQVPEALKNEAFFNAWTRKEAYIKARGKGLSIPLSGFSVTLIPGEPARLIETGHDPEAVHSWSVKDLPVPSNYKGAVVANTGQFEVKLWNGENLFLLKDADF